MRIRTSQNSQSAEDHPFAQDLSRRNVSTVARAAGKWSVILTTTLLLATTAYSSEVNKLTYRGSYNGTSTFNDVHCTIRSGHLMAVMFYPGVGKKKGPNIVFVAISPNGSNQHLGFVPTGKSQQRDYFNASSASHIKGIDTSNLSDGKVVRFHNITLHNPQKPSLKLTLNGSLACSSPNTHR